LLTEKMVKYLGHEDDPAQKEQLELLLFKRAAIVKEAAQKIDALDGILAELGVVSHALVYCHSTPQMQAAMAVMLRRGLRYHRFTGEEGTKPDPQHGGASERETIIRSLDEGDVDALVAMKCLDEGVDVPSASLGVILASSGNPREFIQRRGRLLRRAEGKEQATIYDIVVTPAVRPSADQKAREHERKIFSKELDRIDDFARTAMNALEVRTAVLKMMTGLT